MRRRILTAFEAADSEPDPARRAAWLTFVIVGAGPTGVELAGQIGEIARHAVRGDFRDVDTGSAKILLVETADRVLPPFPPRLSERAERALVRLGVTPLTSHTVVDIEATSLTLTDGNGVDRARRGAHGDLGRGRRRVRARYAPRPRRPVRASTGQGASTSAPT